MTLLGAMTLLYTMKVYKFIEKTILAIIGSIFRKKNYRQTHEMDYMLFACVLKLYFWQLIDKLKPTKLYQELKIVINL